MVEAARSEGSQGRGMWRPRQDNPNERAVPPWADPNAQPPPPPSVFATLSPPPQRRITKPASPLSSAMETNPTPTHFNRPVPGASPVMVRRSLFRNNASARARSVDSINRAPPWADHQLRRTPRTDSPSRAQSGALSPPPSTPPSTSSPLAATSAHSSESQSALNKSISSSQEALINSASTTTTKTTSSKKIASSTEVRRVETKEKYMAVAARSNNEGMTSVPNALPDSAPNTLALGDAGNTAHPASAVGQAASEGYARSRPEHPGQVTSVQTGLAVMQSASGTMVSTRTVTEGQTASASLPQEQSSPTPWRKNVASRVAGAKDAHSPNQPTSQSTHDLSATSDTAHHTSVSVVQEGKPHEQAQQAAPWRRPVTGADQKVPPLTSAAASPSAPQSASEATESHTKGKSDSKATGAQPTWRKQRPKTRQTPPPATSASPVAGTTSQIHAAAAETHTLATEATNTHSGAPPTHESISVTSSVAAISQETSVNKTSVSVQKETKATSLDTSVKVSSSVSSVNTSSSSVATKAKKASSETRAASSITVVSDQTKSSPTTASLTPVSSSTALEATKRVEQSASEEHQKTISERGREAVVVCGARQATPPSSVPSSAAPCSPTLSRHPKKKTAPSSSVPAPPPASQLPAVTPPQSSASPTAHSSPPVTVQPTGATSLGTTIQAGAPTAPSMPIPTPPPAPDTKQLKSGGRAAPPAISAPQLGDNAQESAGKSVSPQPDSHMLQTREGVKSPQPTPTGQEAVSVEVDPEFPPPPSLLPDEMTIAPKTNLMQLPISELDETNTESPDYVRESVTKRIKAFEKQASLDEEPPPPVDRHMPPARPVAPWVKKTSSGLVQQETYWGPTSPEESDAPLPLPPPPPTRTFTERTKSPSRPAPTREPPKAPAAPTPAHRAAPPSASSGARVDQPHAHRHPVPARQRSVSTGDFIAHYITPDGPSKMPAEGGTRAATTPEPPIVPTQPTKDDPLFDTWCDPQNPRVINFQDVSAAAFKIKSGIMNTPCTRSHMSSFTDMEIFFKKEFNQYTGSFKERGARYTLLMLSEEQQKKGVIAASAGNHALALSYHGQDLGVPVTVVMPLVAPIMKVQACRQYGANIIVKGNDIGDCREFALKMAKEQSLLYINGYDHPQILAGQGTMGLEIVEQVPNIDAVVVPVGGGGLIAGVALAVKALYPHVQVIGVESERCASFTAAMKAGRPVYVKAESTLADGLAVPMVGVNAFATARNLVDKVVTVKEEWIAIAILRLVETEKAVVEGAGATALAGILAGELPELKGKRVVIPLCGGNIDTTVLGRCLERGLAADGRLVKFTVTVSDRPGGIAELTRLLANLGVSIKDMVHERAWIRSDIFSVEVKVMAETRDHNHWLELKSALEKRYQQLRFAMPAYIH